MKKTEFFNNQMFKSDFSTTRVQFNLFWYGTSCGLNITQVMYTENYHIYLIQYTTVSIYMLVLQ